MAIKPTQNNLEASLAAAKKEFIVSENTSKVEAIRQAVESVDTFDDFKDFIEGSFFQIEEQEEALNKLEQQRIEKSFEPISNQIETGDTQNARKISISRFTPIATTVIDESIAAFSTRTRDVTRQSRIKKTTQAIDTAISLTTTAIINPTLALVQVSLLSIGQISQIAEENYKIAQENRGIELNSRTLGAIRSNGGR